MSTSSDSDTSTIAASAVLAFSKDIPKDVQTQLRNVILRAILDAKRQFSAAEKPDEWLKAFWAYLSKYGWKGAPPPPLTEGTVVSAATGTPAMTVLQQLMKLLNPSQTALINKVLGLLGDEAKGMRLLGKNSVGPVEVSRISEKGVKSKRLAKGVNFMVGAFSTTPAGSVHLESCHVGYKYDDPDVLLGFEHRIFDIRVVSHTIELLSPASSTSSVAPLDPDREKPFVYAIDMSKNTQVSSSEEQKTSWADAHITKSTTATVFKNPVVIGASNAEVDPKDPNRINIDIELFPAPLRLKGSIQMVAPMNVDLVLSTTLISNYEVVHLTGSLNDGVSIVTKGPLVGSTIKFGIPRTNDGIKHLILAVTMNTIAGNFDYPRIDIPLPWSG
ncbi:hypothetical protein B0H12DRAFT_1130199 [Mycena haematopus]|nr:hypothetical protein B0H12DRAFT_1130199 [Mycena haematopus]